MPSPNTHSPDMPKPPFLLLNRRLCPTPQLRSCTIPRHDRFLPPRSDKIRPQQHSFAIYPHSHLTRQDRRLARKQLEWLASDVGCADCGQCKCGESVRDCLKAPKRIAKHFGDGDLNVFPSYCKGRRRERGGRKGGKRGEEVADRPLGEGVGKGLEEVCL